MMAQWTETPGDDLNADGSYIPEITTALGTTWTIICGALVIFMNAGFALVESGFCRGAACQSIYMKNLLDACFGVLIWFVSGYAIMYGSVEEGTPLEFIGGVDTGKKFFGDGMVDAGRVVTSWVGPNHVANCQDWFFQCAFCVTSATIVSGGVAERLQVGGYLIFTAWMTTVIYPVIGAMTWGGGFLDDIGFTDFAGSGVVHLTGGIGALVGAAVVGPRFGRFEGVENAKSIFRPHSIPSVYLGTFILWFAWFGFNCGSTLYMTGFSEAQSAALVAVNMTIAPAVGAIGTVLLRRFVFLPRKWDSTATCGGVLSGLVSMTAGCGIVHPRAAFVIGSIGSVVFCVSSAALRYVKIDDPVDAFPVHGACGVWGLLAVALFDIKNFGASGDLPGLGIPVADCLLLC